MKKPIAFSLFFCLLVSLVGCNVPAVSSSIAKSEAMPSSVVSQVNSSSSITNMHSLEPFVALEMPAEPIEPVTDKKQIQGIWLHYIDPQTTNTYRPVYQITVEEDVIKLGMGTLNSNYGVFYEGKYTFQDGIAAVTFHQVITETGTVSQPEETVLITFSKNKNEPKKLVAQVVPQSSSPEFKTLFEGIINSIVPFVLYSGE